jgi:phosphoribosylformylglycinamidine synthase
MDREDVRVAVLRIEGTNSEAETAEAFRHLGAQAELVHMNQLADDAQGAEHGRSLDDYHALVFPGGFSAGDYVRAGAIWAARFEARHGEALQDFVDEGKPVAGICNGFQVLVELGLLPDLDLGRPGPAAALQLNDSNHYECRPVLLEHVNEGTCAFTRTMDTGDVVTSVASHAEGKLLFPLDRQDKIVEELEARDQIVFRYTSPDGDREDYPWNPNGSPGGIAALTNAEGNVFGIMPHPERVFHRWQHPDWTRGDADPDGPGDGRPVFTSVLEHLERRF